MFNSKLKGIMFATLSATGYSAVYIFAKFAQRNISTDLFIFWWFLSASIWSLIILIARKGIVKFINKVREHWIFFLYFGVSEAFATFLFFYMVKKLNPSLVSFIINLQPLFVIFWGFLILSEKLNVHEGIGGAIAITGTIMISYASPEAGIYSIAILLFMTIIYSLNIVLVRYKVQGIPAIFIAIFRVYTLFSLYTVYLLAQSKFVIPSRFSMLNIIIGSLFGPVLATFSLFQALKYLKAANVSIIKSIQPFLVFIASYIFLGEKLKTGQFLGGLIIIIGINILILGNRANIKKAFTK